MVISGASVRAGGGQMSYIRLNELRVTKILTQTSHISSVTPSHLVDLPSINDHRLSNLLR